MQKSRHSHRCKIQELPLVLKQMLTRLIDDGPFEVQVASINLKGMPRTKKAPDNAGTSTCWITQT